MLATVIDAACGFAGCYQGPVAAGTRLTATATRSGGGRTIFFSGREVRDAAGRLAATGSGTFKYRS